MWDFDTDEALFLLIAAVAGVAMAIHHYVVVANLWRIPRNRRAFWSLWPMVCLTPTLIVLNTLADPQVRGHIDYMTLFFAGAVVWVFAAVRLLPLAGVQMRDDVLERQNRAAEMVAAAAMLGAGICYAGANIGFGPTIWTTIIPALLAVGVLAVAALVVRMASPLADALAIERDMTSGRIFAAFLLAASLLLAWAIEGNFVTYAGMLIDLARRGSVLVILIIAAIVALWNARPRSIPRGAP